MSTSQGRRRRSDPLGPDEPRGVSVPPADVPRSGDALGMGEPPSPYEKRKYARYGTTQKIVYETNDGEVHDTFAKAVKHVGDAELRTWLYVWFAKLAESFKRSGGPVLDDCAQSIIVQELAPLLHRDWLITKRKEQGGQDA